MNSLKKIAVLLAAALSFGTLSAIPSNAAVLADSFAIDAAADTITAGETATAVVTLTFIAENSGDTVSVLSLISSQPTGAGKTATLSVAETSSAVVTLTGSNTSADVSSTTNTAAQVTAKLNVALVAPSAAGTYVVNLYPVLKSTGGKVTATPLVWTVTVNAADLKASAVNTTSILNNGETVSATADATVSAPKAVSSDAAAVIVVTQKNAAGGAALESLTVTVTGPGLLGHGTNSNVVLATEKVTFYGDIAKIVVTNKKPVLAVGSNAEALTAVAYDANNVVVNSGTLYATSDTLAVVSNSATSASITNGVATFALTGVKTGNAKVGVYSGSIADTATVRVEGAAANIKIAFDKKQYTPGEAAVITVSVTDTAGLPLTGQTFANLFASGGIVSSYAFGAGSDVITGTSVTTDTATATKTFKVFMPSVEVDVKISATGGTSLVEAGRITVSDSATVFNPTRAVTDSALEAAKEATEAAQAATDAAILAQKSADAATLAADLAAKTSAEAAAQAKAALDAVNALSLQVTKMIANFAKMQKTIAAIAKKVKA